MNLLRASRSFVVLLFLSAAIIGSLGYLGKKGRIPLLVPPPEEVALQFAKAIEAKRYESADKELVENHERKGDISYFRNIAEGIEERHKGISTIEPHLLFISQNEAPVELHARFEDKAKQVIRVELSRENGLWKISEFEEMGKLAGLS